MTTYTLLSAVDTVNYFNSCENHYCDTSGGDRAIRPKTKPQQGNNLNAKVYPNPASTELIVEVNLQKGQTNNICIYDAMGKEVRCEELTNNVTVLPINDLAIGIYLYRIVNNNGTLIKTDKVMIIH